MKKLELEVEKLDPTTYPYGQEFFVLEAYDSWTEVYDQGFVVHFVKESQSDYPIVCRKRSVRVDLEKFALSSENRRILRKVEYLELEAKPMKNFAYDPIQHGKFSRDNFHKRGIEMHISKVKRIYTAGLNNLIFIFRDKEVQKEIAYATAISRENFLHYTYPFYNVEYFRRNVGIGMMLKALLWTQSQGKKYIYLGTCNNESAFYKLQFMGVEWFEGQGWSNDIKGLKELIRAQKK